MKNRDLDDLERKAKAATPGPWKEHHEPFAPNETAKKAGLNSFPRDEITIHTAWDHGQLHGPAPIVTTAHTPFFGDRTVYIHMREEDAAHIAAANPAAVLELVAEVRRMRAVMREAVGKLTNLHCKTRRDQSKLCMAFDALFVEANRE